MAKKKKTREQKILADRRHVESHVSTSASMLNPVMERKESFSVNLPYVTKTAPAATAANYSFVVSDVRKTATITFGIVLVQLVLYFFFNRI